MTKRATALSPDPCCTRCTGTHALSLIGPEPPNELVDGVRAAWAILHSCSSSVDGLSLCLEPDAHAGQLERAVG